MPIGKEVRSVESNIDQKANFFKSAKPVWPEELMGQMNYMVGFRAVVNVPKQDTAILKIAVSTLYRVFINGEFIGYGPARAARGYFRVDELDVTNKLAEGKNVVVIEVAAYNIDNTYIMEQPEFLQAELVLGDTVLASTCGEGILFEARLCKERVQKVPRYSLQRGFVEYYRFDSHYEDWKTKLDYKFQPLRCKVLPEKNLLLRMVDYPDYTLRLPVKEIETSTFEDNSLADTFWMPRYTPMVGRITKGFANDELEVNPIRDLQGIRLTSKVSEDVFINGNYIIGLNSGSYKILDFGTNLSGFIGATVTVKEKTKLIFLFDEILFNGDIDLRRSELNNMIVYELEKGTYNLESFETYTLKYLKVMVFEGSCEISNIHIREYASPDVYRAYFSCSDRRLNRLFEAGRETFRQNAVDILTDCPSRERGGYLCDSFFSARVAFDLSGNTRIEKNFIENFLLPDKFDKLPEGMWPMCYPADVKVNYMDPSSQYGLFIPNWSLWFVIQLEEYLKRSGDTELVKQAKPKVIKLFEYFKTFENDDGLLEKLEGWIFVDWSKANDYVQDVNYPTNMLYAGALAAAGRIFGISEFLEHSERLKKVIQRQSYDGKFFRDNAVRRNEDLIVTNNKTEVCQYYAFFFEVATPETHKLLWDTLITEFGPKRKSTGVYPDVDPTNAFIGNYLRLELLSRYGLGKQLVDEASNYLMYMVDKTGTLWEHATDSGSCNHGFASHIVHWLYNNVLGISNVDVLNKTISIKFEASDCNWSEGRIPLCDGYLSVRWWKENNTVFYSVELPAGFKLEVENMTGMSLARK